MFVSFCPNCGCLLRRRGGEIYLYCVNCGYVMEYGGGDKCKTGFRGVKRIRELGDDLGDFKLKYRRYPMGYKVQYDNFWRWKLRVEVGDAHILDDVHRGETYRRLCRVLPGWLTYRPFNMDKCLEILKFSLEEISEAYDEIRGYSLLDFDKIPRDALEIIWHGLGRVKERDGSRNQAGYYYVVAVCKPLMFLWGQTLAFDSRVRRNICGMHISRDEARWNFQMRREVLIRMKMELEQSPGLINLLREKCREEYLTEKIVPYGRFLDIYYFYKES